MSAPKLVGKSAEILAIEEVSRLVSQKTGIILGERQHNMVRTRLLRRMTELKFNEYDEYLEHLRKNVQNETEALTSLLTTHHTYFFREFVHFEFLRATAIPALVEIARARPDKTIRIWSAACSRGQEVYSLAMIVDETLSSIAPDVKFHIVGSDVDQESVELARNAVYPWSEVKEIPMNYLTRYWARGKGDISEFAKVKSQIKSCCEFRFLNLVDLPQMDSFDIVICRNVLIYFDNQSISKIAKNLFDRLHSHGYLIVGVSESLIGQSLPIQHLGPSIYGKIRPQTKTAAPTVATPVAKISEPKTRTVTRVLCVDDSPSIIAIMKKILSAEKGFEVVATAKNGIEAAEALRRHQVDVMTLDIHMPEQTGIEYLQKNFKPGHVPVIMVTSVSREDSSLAQQALKLGASDYIEKPTLQNFSERAGEIQNKIFAAIKSKSSKPVNTAAFDFSKPLNTQAMDKCAIVFILPAQRISDLERVIADLRPSPAVTVTALIENLKDDPKILADKLEQRLKGNKVHVSSIDNMTMSLAALAGKKTCFCFFKGISASQEKRFSFFREQWKVAEDGMGSSLKFDDITPATSFVYLALKYFTGGK
jgi:chemotaxis protein methyltransferase CheR